MKKNAKIYVAGHNGMVGSAIVRKLQSAGYNNLVLRTHQELDLVQQSETEHFFERAKPEYVFLAAAKVGGILANDTYRAQFLYKNLMIQANIIHAAYKYGVKKLLFLGSSCIYPKLAPQPLKEKYLLTGPLEPTNEPYAIAKIAGIKLCQSYNAQHGTNFISCMPTNLYGPYDNFDLATSHVLPALIRKFHEAKIKKQSFVEIWGDGSPRREFMHVDDLADACCFLMQKYDESDIINVGCGKDLTIKELAMMTKEIIGYDGDLRFDSSKPTGTPRKLLDVAKLQTFGWEYKISLSGGLADTYKWYLSHLK